MNKKYTKYLILYLLTIISTYITWGGWYCIAIMAILSAHELGHYLMSRRYGISSTLPLFIPFPFSPFGTLGAVIKMRGTIYNRRALFDIGAAGPLTGLALTIPAIILGLRLSRVVAVAQLPPQSIMSLGDSLLFSWLERIVLGPIPAGHDVILHPIAYAGWVGLFVTALNLLPIGQLDGGHIVYSLWGEKSILIFKLVLGVLALVSLVFNPGWFLLVILLLFLGLKHPPPIDNITPLDSKRKWLGIFTLIIFILSFTPVPFPDYIAQLKQELPSLF
jgi:membrane-associated protease RseP (regulator of RpoE activity)